MGAIIAYKETGGDPEENRKEGMMTLGALLRGIDVTNNLRDELYDRLRAFVDEGGGTLRWRCQDGGATKELNVASFAKRGKDYIDFELESDGRDNILQLSVQEDSRDVDNPSKRIFRMATVFPDDADWGGLGYLETVADEIGVPTGAVTDAANYLAVFKLLGRCH